MKIKDVTTILAGENGRNWLVVKVETDNGLVGYGEATLEGREKTTETAVLELKRYLIGKDPTEIERHWQAIYRRPFWKGGPVLCTALSGVEHALWDILGKSLGVPVYKLLGGPCRDKVKVYTHVAGLTPEELGVNAKRLVKKGYRALKLMTDGANSYDVTSIPSHGDVMQRRPIKETVARVEAVRNAVGDKVDIMLDAHGRLDPRTATILAHELEPFNLLFFEEPIPPDNVDSMMRVSRAVNIPIASGERLYTKYGFVRLIENEAIDVVQADVCHAGGLSECKKIAAMAEAHYLTMAPHNPNGPIGSVVAIHLDASIPNFLIQEMIQLDLGHRKYVLKTPLTFENGFVKLPNSPGLGVDLNEEVVKEARYEEQDLPLVHYEDGSVADW